MPEIKNTFVRGRMNKDLDERLVPKGEYRNAMNIQVSTSEGSDVGTVQNILGNSLVPGQDFISDNSVCIGSVADEKNDKLYYFVNASNEIIRDPHLVDNTNWTIDSGLTEDYSGEGVLISSAGDGTAGQYAYFVQGFDLEDGKQYELTVEFSEYDNDGDPGGSIMFWVGGNNWGSGLNAYRPFNNPVATDGIHLYDFVFDKSQNNDSTNMRFFMQLTNADSYAKSIRIKSVSLTQTQSGIIEYNSKDNSITPVLIDNTNSVLQFSPNRLITGINIIDDILLWTDNYSEPKKINIPRSIQGTDPSGLVHTKFINEAQDISNIDIREEHITVIKKSPKNSPSIELISERDSDYTYTGVMRIQDGSLGEAGSSLRVWGDWVAPWGYPPYGGPNNFSDLSVGQQFYTYIETDINGDSGFTLDWQVGDIVVFKEFEDEEPPQVPITDYTIKAKIVTPPTGSNIFTDDVSEMASNPNLEIPSSTGTRAFGVAWGSSLIYYNPITSSLDYSISAAAAAYQKLESTPINPWDSDSSPGGGRYKITINISGRTYGRIKFYIVDNDATLGSGSKPRYWTTPYFHDNIDHEFTFTLNEDTGSTASDFSNRSGRWMLGVDDSTGFDGSINSVSIEYLDAANARVALEVLDISGFPSTPIPPKNQLRYAVDRLDEKEKLFEFKFPRFAYRYQYQDREYSNISPFSPIAFIPGSFDYHPRKGYNLGMTNRLDKIKIKDFVTDVPNGVVAIDILYKEDVSPNIYVVDTIKPKHSPLDAGGVIWDENVYIVKSELVKQVLPSNQILRPWDAVPRKALAQDITGNRVVYGNYVQNYDLKHDNEDYYPDFDFIINSSVNDLSTVKSIKSLREYQLGVVFVDEYGRETPVITNTSGVSNVTKLQSNKENKINVSFNNHKFPHDMKYFKFFIKETSGEYYNMAMDRWYDAEDEHVWLSFPSSDRAK